MKKIRATILNPINDKKCELFKDGLLVVKNSKIVDYGSYRKLNSKYSDATLIDKTDQIIMPGFYDMHFHWVQDDVSDMPKENLLSWLENYTFPAEAKFKNKKYSKQKAQSFFSKISAMGTIGGGCYSSVHSHALEDAFSFAQGDYVIGNVLMTMNSPDFLKQTKSNAIKLVRSFTQKYKHRYCLTPRFAPTTHPDVMTETGKMAKKVKAYIQTHLCETNNEIDWVLSMYREMKGFEDVNSYTDVYHRCGLLGPRTLMGHGVYLNQEDRQLLSKTNTVVVHCPTSNAPIKENGLGSGLFNFKQAESDGIDWVMGSDIGGGPFLSMFDVIRSFVDQNKKKKIRGATFVKGLYRSTLKGAQILRIDKKKGNFAPGKEANFICINLPKNPSFKSSEELLESVIKPLSRNRKRSLSLVKQTYLKGQLIHDSIG